MDSAGIVSALRRATLVSVVQRAAQVVCAHRLYLVGVQIRQTEREIRDTSRDQGTPHPCGRGVGKPRTLEEEGEQEDIFAPGHTFNDGGRPPGNRSPLGAGSHWYVEP